MDNTGLEALKKKNQEDISHRELDTILRFGTLISSSLHIEDVLDHAMKWAEEFMDAEASSVYELDKERNELFIRLARGEKRDPIKGIRLKVGEGIAGWVVQTGRPVVSQDVRKDKRFSDKYDKKTGFKTKSMICVPLISKDEPIGALQVINKRSKKPFSKTDFKLLTGMAQQIAVATENAKLYERLEEDFALTTQELKITQEKLIRSERLMAMGHLVQGVAHEIRNPIMTIGGFTQRLKRELGKDHKLQKYVDIILEETVRLEKLVEQVREFMNVQSASLSMEKITPVMDEVIRIFKPLAKGQGVRLVAEIDGDTPFIEMDSPQLVTALSNIMENALESMPGGGTLSLSVNRTNNNVLITIRDTGCGVAAEQLESIYDPFVTSKTRGAGLGLTMVYRIIMNHHGEIKISSQLEKGTIVIIRLPVPTGQ
ncbi:MAG: GAF domain-containing protein [Deltaproteobacteria bacterium]|nr:MAG: GAF domain-containing protein [Deltaproteobacteria bacterium]